MSLFSKKKPEPSQELLRALNRIEQMHPQWIIEPEVTSEPFPSNITLKYISRENISIYLSTSVSISFTHSSIQISQRYTDGRPSVIIYSENFQEKDEKTNEEYLRRYIQKIAHPVLKIRAEDHKAYFEARREKERIERSKKEEAEQKIKDKFWNG